MSATPPDALLLIAPGCAHCGLDHHSGHL